MVGQFFQQLLKQEQIATMDQASLAKLVAEQAKVIEQLKIERDSASQLMKEEILSSLKEDLRPRRRKKSSRLSS